MNSNSFRFRIFVCLFSLCTITSNAESISVPTYEEVVARFAAKYKFKEEGDRSIQLEKRPDGWHIVEWDMSAEGYRSVNNWSVGVKDQLFWDKRARMYRLLDYELLPKGGSQDRVKSILNKGSYKFEFPYFGYPDWSQESIRMESTFNLSDDGQLFALASAYSDFAQVIISFPDAEITGPSLVDLKEVPYDTRLSDPVLTKFRYYAHRSIGLLRILEKRNPDYETFVGSIRDKIANDQLHYYLLVKSNWGPYSAARELDDVDYCSAMKSFAKNILTSCPKNAILFTNGDNDTFPLWYLQFVQRYREDVTVINLSLMNASWYDEYIKNDTMDFKPAPIGLNADKYISSSRDYIPYYDRGLEEAVDLGDLLNFMASDEENTKAKTMAGESINYYPTRNVYFAVAPSKAISNPSTENRSNRKIVDKLELQLPASYLLKSNLILLNILYNNDWNRPVCFTTSVLSDNDLMGIQKYFKSQGLVYEVVSVFTPVIDELKIGYRDPHSEYDLLVNKFTYDFSDLENGRFQIGDLGAATSYIISFGNLAEALINENDYSKALNALDKCITLFPDDFKPYGYFMVPIANSYFNIAKYYNSGIVKTVEENTIRHCRETGLTVLKTTSDNCIEGLDDCFDSGSGFPRKKKKQSFRQALYILNSIMNIYNENGYVTLSKEIDAQMNAYMARFPDWNSTD